MFDFLKPRWKKEAKHLIKGAKKYVHYKRDLLDEAKIAEIESRRSDLKNAIKGNDQKVVEEAGKQLRATCEKALPRAPQQTWWEENVEVMFVALVIALGLRAYVLQPFRIPTGSMQPTLNGIIIQNEGPDFEKPWLGAQAWDLVFSGRTYKNIVAEEDMETVSLKDKSWFLFTRTEAQFDNGTKIKFPVAEGEVSRLLFDEVKNIDGDVIGYTAKKFKRGDPILRGSITTGDLVLVDRISYHFRRPERGEVFVFDTRGIPTKRKKANDPLRDQTGGTHYIKRLCGVPGDVLSIETPDLLNHGRILQEPTIRRVAEREGLYREYIDNAKRPGYTPALGARSSGFPLSRLDGEGSEFALKDTDELGMREYAALGDNTANSLDSRYWGAVHEFNLVGPGWFSLWPFGSGHWGFIK